MAYKYDVSVIIPVYNTPNEILDRCIKSIYLNENWNSGFEVIVVDDGSNSDCAAKLDTFVHIYDNFRVFHNCNQGVSSARNYGVDMANGRYIMFIDADDIIGSAVIGNAYQIAQVTDADIIIGGVKSVKENEVEEKISYANEVSTNQLYEILSESEKEKLRIFYLNHEEQKYKNIDEDSTFIAYAYARLIKYEIVQNVKFSSKLAMWEDCLWNLELLTKEVKVVLHYQTWYYYIQNTFSATNSYRENIIKEVAEFCFELKKILLPQNKDYIKLFSEVCLARLGDIEKLYLLHPKSNLSLSEKMKKMRETLRNEPYKSYFSKEYVDTLSLVDKFKVGLYKTGFIIPVRIIKEIVIIKR